MAVLLGSRVALLAAVASCAIGQATVCSAAVLRSNGIGPLRIGMSLATALKTGWLADRGRGCPLGGQPPLTYRLTGRRAPKGVRGSVEFTAGRLSAMSFTGGVRTGNGIAVGSSTTTEMVARFRREGFKASSRYDATFQGTFVAVRSGGREIFAGFAPQRKLTILAIPAVPVCE